MKNKLLLGGLLIGFSLIVLGLVSKKTFAATPLKWGAYAGWQPSDFINFQNLVGRKMDYLAVFVHWGNENQFPSEVAKLAASNGQTVVIYWEAMDYNIAAPQNDTRFSYDQILSGRYAAYIQSFAASAKSANVPVILIPFEEMNGNWYPWSITENGNTPQKHIDAYRYIRSFFNDVPNVKFGWDINNDSVPDTQVNQPMSFYPGDDVVDIVGVDGFNFANPWQSFSSAFSNSLNRLSLLNKPMIIFSMASADGTEKANWIRDAAVQMNNYPNLIGWIWFNENKERDWRVNSDVNSLTAFQNYLVGATVIVSPSTSPTPTPTVVSISPTVTPTPTMSLIPTLMPTATPTMVPTSIPTLMPTAVPTILQTPSPTPTPKIIKKLRRRENKYFGWWSR